jgi:hypothetical protein
VAEIRAIAATPASHPRHTLHAPDRAWPETNCYLDLWIGLLSAIGQDPRPVLGVAASLDWEADHVTFLKPCAADLFQLTGAVLHELALYDSTARQVASQVARGAVPLIEVDAFFLPDTEGAAYRERHTKTTIGIVAMDPDAGWIDYVHNAGLFRLSGDDFCGVLGVAPHPSLLFPYAELVRLPASPPAADQQRAHARACLRRFAATRQPGNPITRFAAALPALMTEAGGDGLAVHALCFNTARQLGSAFGLFSDHLSWLGAEWREAAALADNAKTLQFQIARAARRGRDDPGIATLLEEMAGQWLRVMSEADAASALCGK